MTAPAEGTRGAVANRSTAAVPIASIVGFLVCVEIASGTIQGYFTPLFTDIARHLNLRDAEVNWFEAAQLALSAIAVPVLSKLGDLHGHRRILLASTVVAALACWGVALAPTPVAFAAAWALVGVYVVWLPMEVAIVHRRTAGDDRRTRLASSVLVAALETSVIASALLAGALATRLSMTALLAVPAVVVTLSIAAIWWGVPAMPPAGTGRFDGAGTAWLTLGLGAIMGGLMLLRVLASASPWPWLLLAVGALLGIAFARVELRVETPLVDLRVLGSRRQWPIQVVAMLFGASVLGAQIPLSTFARTDPAVAGYGLGATASGVSLIIGAYVVSLLLGALCVPLLTRWLPARGTMVVGCALVAVGYALFLPSHGSLVAVLANMLLAGLGSGMLVALLPAVAAQYAPPTHTAVATGMTNAIKTVGGAFASCAYALALGGAGLEGPAANHAPLSGYLTVWAICAGTAGVAGTLLLLTRRPRPGADRE